MTLDCKKCNDGYINGSPCDECDGQGMYAWDTEFRRALRVKECPRCINCEKEMDIVMMGDAIWTWNNTTKKYEHTPGGTHEDDKPYCWNCGAKDYEIIEEHDEGIQLGLAFTKGDQND